MLFNWKKPEKPNVEPLHYELLARIFGLEEAKKHFLNVIGQPNVTAEQVLSDSAALEFMMGQKGWAIYEKAVWFKLLTALRLNLSAKTLEEREGARHQVLALLGCLHLPYEMRYAADGIRRMKELEKSLKETQV